MTTSRYSNLINPQNAEIDQIEEAILKVLHATDNRWSGDLLRTALQYFLKTFKFDLITGFLPVEQTIRSRHGNCISLGCLLASTLIRLGIHNPAVFIGCHIWQPSRTHAYVMLPGERQGQIIVIDPEFMKPLFVSLEQFLTRYRIYLIFDQQRQAISAEEKKMWLKSFDQEVARPRAAMPPESACSSGV